MASLSDSSNFLLAFSHSVIAHRRDKNARDYTIIRQRFGQKERRDKEEEESMYSTPHAHTRNVYPLPKYLPPRGKYLTNSCEVGKNGVGTC